MYEFRITLISDPMDEFANSQNTSFKVRLPVYYLESGTGKALHNFCQSTGKRYRS